MTKHGHFDPTSWSLGIIQGYACLCAACHTYQGVKKIAAGLVSISLGREEFIIYNNPHKGV